MIAAAKPEGRVFDADRSRLPVPGRPLDDDRVLRLGGVDLIAISCFIDIFRRHDIGGVHKAAWVVFIIVIPFLGVLVY